MLGAAFLSPMMPSAHALLARMGHWGSLSILLICGIAASEAISPRHSMANTFSFHARRLLWRSSEDEMTLGVIASI